MCTCPFRRLPFYPYSCLLEQPLKCTPKDISSCFSTFMSQFFPSRDRTRICLVQRTYWRKTLAGAPSKPSIRTDFELSAGLSSPGKFLRVTVPADVTQGLESLALACGATLFTVAMAAWQVLLLRPPNIRRARSMALALL